MPGGAHDRSRVARGVTAERAFWVPEAVPGTEGLYRLTASDAACVGIPGRRAPMGGVTTGAAIEAMELATNRSLFWATSQFVEPAPTETDFDIRVDVVGRGRSVQRARATLLDGDRVILVAAGALGTADETDGQTFAPMPPVPPPGDCRRLDAPDPGDGGLMSQFDRRRARRDEASGRDAVWFRPVAAHPVRAGLLAILGDFLAGAHPDTRGSVGFDNTLRMVARPDTEWILADMAIAHIGDRTFHGAMHLFSESGRLMAIASLTALRPRARAPG